MLKKADMSRLAASAGEAAAMLRLLANEKRLLILCMLAVNGEAKVSDIAAEVDLGMSALSQHLAKLRDDGLVEARKEQQMVFYRIADPDAAKILKVLKDIYCP
ncbi:MAG: metalloregulator ArsR/SmtB family transcription factor [Parvibaculum sp.]|jgi:DNA-binding transcriptional ArsR family regulator|uniref:ArsR/SmtB family transcription factor n=1 Tax=Parvibaculum sp. TaxID=2024848 RepID=UPI002842F15B|nr:metalloregulator ArsR/SmtB family transcription factor [Parvibaculum sp.]MDR3498024.1 metalloregulator ArsR/SmtB family transcription factor [Parvibaculum sp.]